MLRYLKNSTFLNDFGSWKIWSEEEKARSQLFWVWRIQFNEVVLNPEDPKNVGWGLFLPQFIILKLKKELKMHFFYTRSLFFPAFIFFPVSPETKKIGAGKKSDPLYRKTNLVRSLQPLYPLFSLIELSCTPWDENQW